MRAMFLLFKNNHVSRLNLSTTLQLHDVHTAWQPTGIEDNFMITRRAPPVNQHSYFSS